MRNFRPTQCRAQMVIYCANGVLNTCRTQKNTLDSSRCWQNPTTSREKLNYLLAQNTRPACFLMRSICTPQENRLAVILSMVERSGQPLVVGCFPVKAVSHPVTFYRPTVRSLTVVPEKLFTGATPMTPLFSLLHRPKTAFFAPNFCAAEVQHD